MTKPVVQLRDILSQDADDVTRSAVALTSDKKVAAVRELAGHFSAIQEDIGRMKLLLFFQSALASLSTRTVPIGTAALIVEQVQPSIATLTDSVARRVALQVLALVFLKSREVTVAIDKPIRAAFKAARSDADETVRAFAKTVLSNTGVLQQRTVRAALRAGELDNIRTMPASGRIVNETKRVFVKQLLKKGVPTSASGANRKSTA